MPLPSGTTLSGRAASIARRTALSAGKTALPAAAERIRTGERSASVPPMAAIAPAAVEAKPAVAPAPPAPTERADCNHASCRAAARARRATLSQHGRGDAPPSPPSRAPRQHQIQYAPKVAVSATHSRQTVTGLRIGRGLRMTGDEAGSTLPVSGTQYIGADSATPVRSGGPKVGLARTVSGGVVSGTMVRSRVAITGDEAGAAITITGEAEQRPEDDLTERSGAGGYADAQFRRQADPHGTSVFGTNLGRSARSIGSRDRQRSTALESTQRGLPITGSAVGRTTRVTGDENGACHHITGDQYLTPARAQAECGGTGGGTAPAAQIGAGRRDPVSGGKVAMAQTWGRQRVSGANIEHDARVTGDAPGSCAVLTGTPYQGRGTLQQWCDPAAGAEAEQRLPRRAAAVDVSGDTPVHGGAVSGLDRGAGREITGTPYYRAPVSIEAPADPVAALDERFSVGSPQRAAHLRADREAPDAPSAAGRITGSFAVGSGKVTGNREFSFQPRRASGSDSKPAHAGLTGEGSSAGRRMSGGAWEDRPGVTGTEGFTAAERNPSERGPKAEPFAGAMRFKPLAKQEERKQLVTGMFGWSSKTAAKVTLSGGAQG